MMVHSRPPGNAPQGEVAFLRKSSKISAIGRGPALVKNPHQDDGVAPDDGTNRL